MKMQEMLSLINGKLISDTDNIDREIKGGCGADLMSDVLAFIQPDAVLFTGLCNPQVVRTAHMADVAAIVVVRGKKPPQETIDLATEENIPLISTPLGTFEICGRLYAAGLPSLEKPVGDEACSCDE
jgi:predicted transcriptional regulator